MSNPTKTRSLTASISSARASLVMPSAIAVDVELVLHARGPRFDCPVWCTAILVPAGPESPHLFEWSITESKRIPHARYPTDLARLDAELAEPWQRAAEKCLAEQLVPNGTHHALRVPPSDIARGTRAQWDEWVRSDCPF
jgi:hypothetical protein